MATAIFFNGRRINIPQAVSKIDATALASVSPSSTGIVALLGTAEGGKPLTIEEEFADFTRADKLRTIYRDGDLLKAGLFAFEPSADQAIPGGAQKLVNIKVNPATQSTLTLPDALAADSVDLISRDFGQFTEQISIDVAAGTTKGKLISLVFEDETETFDDVGGDSVMDVIYAPGADGYDTMVGAFLIANFTAAATKAEAGLTTEITAVVPAGLPAALEAVSSDGGDTTQTLTIYGLVGGTTATQETISLNGTTPVPTTVTTSWSHVLGAALSAATTGTITLRVVSAGATALTLAPAVLTRGIVQTTNTPVDGVLTVSIDVDTAIDVAMFGTTSAGAATGERFDMTAGNTTPVVGVVTFGSLTVMALGEAAGARTITVAANALQASSSVFKTIQALVDKINTLAGFTANGTVTNVTTFLTTDMDFDVAGTLIGSAKDFFADLNFFIRALGTTDTTELGSQFVSAARASGASLVPANTAAPLFLAGGIEGVTTIAEWTTAFQLLQKREVNIIVPLTRDPAIHALLLSHLVARAGRLANTAGEANGYVGHGDSVTGQGATRTVFQAEIQALNTRHISSIAQEVQRFDPNTGLATFFEPHFLAAIAAGMQAGSAIAEPLTRKTMIALDLRNDPSWDVEDDASDLIDRGLMMAEKVDGIGIRWIRSVTTHLADDNIAFTEMSANESANTSAKRLRRNLDLKIGNRGLGGTAAALKGLAQDELERQLVDDVIVAFKSLQVSQIGDVFPVSFEVATVNPVNFVPITIHLQIFSTAA